MKGNIVHDNRTLHLWTFKMPTFKYKIDLNILFYILLKIMPLFTNNESYKHKFAKEIFKQFDSTSWSC